ncbi:hypothetical protein PS903_03848 [Pseudomonas fluorescens]|nr:hypothetical protein PS903_03848 [Pseudomonas fluorescens]
MKSWTELGSRDKTLIAWGMLDATAILWYCINALTRGRIPYISDILSTQDVLLSYGPEAIYLIAISWIFQISLVLSCALFLCRHRYAKFIGYIQIPFRLFLLLPSVSLVLIVAKIFPGPVPIYVALIVISEFLKGRTLWKYT